MNWFTENRKVWFAVSCCNGEFQAQQGELIRRVGEFHGLVKTEWLPVKFQLSSLCLTREEITARIHANQ